MSSRRFAAYWIPVVASILLGMTIGGQAAAETPPGVPGGALAEVSAEGDAAAVDPALDPWLSDQAPVVAKPVETAQERVTAAWKAAPAAAQAYASRTAVPTIGCLEPDRRQRAEGRAATAVRSRATGSPRLTVATG